jgi:hypothetical protein
MPEAEKAFRQHVSAIQSFRAQDLNEAMTRKYLVDPILAMLGYESPEELHLEVRVPNSGEFIDYELLVDGQPRAIVEAKALRNGLTEQHAAQCVQYAALLGVQWCLVTNGLVWAVYDAYAPVALAEKRVVEVRLQDDPDDLDHAWHVFSQFQRDALRESEPLSEILIERIVAQEFQRPDSSVIKALRSAIKSRVGHRVSAESVVAALSRMTGADRKGGRATMQPAEPTRKARDRALDKTGLRDLIDAGLLPPDASLEMKWRDAIYSGRVRGGQIEVNGRLFPTPSAAGSFARKGAATNGWKWWRYNGEALWLLRERLRSRP